MKVNIEADEFYPVYYIDTDFGNQTIEIEEAQLNWISQVWKDWHDAQKYLARRYKESYPQGRPFEDYN